MDKKQKLQEQQVIVVDELNNPTGQYAPRHKAHTGDGIHHRAFVCYLLNHKGEILLQKRKHWLWDGLWDVTAVSHPLHLPDHDETYDEATARALKKEMGIENVKVKKVGGFNYFTKHEKDNGCENEYCAIMTGGYNGKVNPDPEDVYEYKWTPWQDFVNDVKNNPKTYTPWAILVVKTLENEPIISSTSRKI